MFDYIYRCGSIAGQRMASQQILVLILRSGHGWEKEFVCSGMCDQMVDVSFFFSSISSDHECDWRDATMLFAEIYRCCFFHVLQKLMGSNANMEFRTCCFHRSSNLLVLGFWKIVPGCQVILEQYGKCPGLMSSASVRRAWRYDVEDFRVVMKSLLLLPSSSILCV